jgi:hypothetical protein
LVRGELFLFEQQQFMLFICLSFRFKQMPESRPWTIVFSNFLFANRLVSSNPVGTSLEYLLGSRTVTYDWPCHIGIGFSCDF